MYTSGRPTARVKNLRGASEPVVGAVAQEENLALLCAARSTFTTEQSGVKKDAVLSHADYSGGREAHVL